jgi:NADPH-dependent curcumin reductase CurA
VDIFFDNVGGETLEAVLMNLRTFARISLCGQISGYNDEKLEYGPRLYMNLVVNQAKMQGYLVGRWADQFPKAIAELKQWYKEGKINSKETIISGPITDVPKTFIELFKGNNIGKMIHSIES